MKKAGTLAGVSAFLFSAIALWQIRADFTVP